eukprot:GHVR01088321.1.p1 GENE.GHVR01088321.1~~GHVR01088321.1.p1  ORF type:complete len:358 (-),score=102.81 GHVR01088321.1:190-1263(-)
MDFQLVIKDRWLCCRDRIQAVDWYDDVVRPEVMEQWGYKWKADCDKLAADIIRVSVKGCSKEEYSSDVIKSSVDTLIQQWIVCCETFERIRTYSYAGPSLTEEMCDLMEETVRAFHNFFSTIEHYKGPKRAEKISHYAQVLQSICQRLCLRIPRTNQQAVSLKLVRVLKALKEAWVELKNEVQRPTDVEGEYHDPITLQKLGMPNTDVDEDFWASDNDNDTEPMDTSERAAGERVVAMIQAAEKIIKDGMRTITKIPNVDATQMQSYPLKVFVRTLEATREEAENLAASAENLVNATFAPQDIQEVSYRLHEFYSRVGIFDQLLLGVVRLCPKIDGSGSYRGGDYDTHTHTHTHTHK